MTTTEQPADEPADEYDEPLNPVSVEEAIRRASRNIARGVRVVTEAHRAYLAADRAYDHAYAKAFLDHTGPQTEKRYAAELATVDEREARDVAYLAFRHAERIAASIEDELRALQSVNKSVASMYGATTGVGR